MIGRQRGVCFVVIGTLAVFNLQGQYTLSIDNTDPWEPQADFVGLAGDDYPASFESDPNQYQLSVAPPGGPPGSQPDYEVTVRREDTVWDPGLTLEVRRTGDGGGPGTISGGLGYLAVSTTDAIFFEGRGRKSNIPVQLRLSGAFGGEGVPAGSYTTTVIYTIADR